MINTQKTIWIVGSLNADLVQCVNRIPQPGETLAGGDLHTYPGGKGANQAVAAARLGGHTRMIGNVGQDRLGSMLLESLSSAGVDVSGVKRIETSTGAASIYVLEDGENAIVISPGANGCLSAEDVRERLSGIQANDFLLCQLESPVETVLEALRIAKEAGATTILDPSPAPHFTPDLLPYVDILTPNEIEAETIVNQQHMGTYSPNELNDLVERIRALGCNSVVLKRGEAGCYFSDGTISASVQGHSVQIVDTTGAGDTFNGALATGLSAGNTMQNALEFANAAAGLAVTKSGAQPSIPSREDVEVFLKHNSARQLNNELY